MTTKKKRSDDAALAEWAEDPTTWTAPEGVLRGDAAAAYGRSVLETAGVDIAVVERAAGRPRVGPGANLSARHWTPISATQSERRANPAGAHRGPRCPRPHR